MEEKKSNSIKVILYISIWVIIWGTLGSFIDYPLYKNKIYLEGSIYQYLTFTVTAIISVIGANFFFFIKNLSYKNLYLNFLIILAGSFFSFDS
jgi:hypothetical protein